MIPEVILCLVFALSTAGLVWRGIWRIRKGHVALPVIPSQSGIKTVVGTFLILSGAAIFLRAMFSALADGILRFPRGVGISQEQSPLIFWATFGLYFLLSVLFTVAPLSYFLINRANRL